VDAAALMARLPPSLRARVEQPRVQRLGTLARNLSIAEHTREILDAAGAAAVPMLPLKGALLAHTIYEDPGLRPMRDVDLLVRPRDLERAIALLARLGFSVASPPGARFSPRHAHAVALVDTRRELAIDLHHRLFHELDGDSDAEPFFARAIEVVLAGRARAVPAWEDSLFLAALHGAVDGFGGPPWWLLDFALLIGRADFARAADEARRRRLRVAFAVAVELARRALPGVVPAARWSPSSLRRLLLRVTLGPDPLGTPPDYTRNLIARLLLADGLGGARELIRKTRLRGGEALARLRSRG
jgi:hypothetical protein